MLYDNRGIALVTVILMTAVIMVIVSLVGYKVMRSTAGSAAEGLKTKTYYAANSGLDVGRLYLSQNYVSKNYWGYILDPDTDPDYSGPAVTPTADIYLRVGDMEPANYVSNPPLTIRTYVKDNNDDGNYAIDTDQLVMVNIEATTANGEVVTLVEARLLYDDSIDSYAQLGGSAGREHFREVSGVGQNVIDDSAGNTTSIGLDN